MGREPLSQSISVCCVGCCVVEWDENLSISQSACAVLVVLWSNGTRTSQSVNQHVLCWLLCGSQQELDSRRLLSTSGVRRKKLSARRHKASAAGDSDDEEDDSDDENDDLTDINDCRCQLCHKICFLSAVSSSSLHNFCTVHTLSGHQVSK